MSCDVVKCVCECRCDHDLVLRIIDKILNYKSCECDCDWEKGEVLLNTGRHEIHISTKAQPERVFLCNQSCHQVCGTGVDLFAARVVEKGFVLLSDVQNDNVKVEWIAQCKDSCCGKK